MSDVLVKLTQKQENFCQAIADGKNASDAYRTAYNTSAGYKHVNEVSSRMMANDKIRTRVRELKEAIAEKVLWTREDSIRALKDSVDEKGAVRVSAVKELNAMHGFNAPKKVEHSGTITNINLKGLSDEELELMERLLAKTQQE